MNVTMSFHPCRSQSRVEFIKRKFETSFAEENVGGSLKRTNDNVLSKSNFWKELENLNLNASSETCLETNDGTKNEGKTLVRRSPAFRRGKFSSSKSSTQNSQVSGKPEKDNSKENNCKKILKKDVAIDCNDFKRSKTDTNLLKYFNSHSSNSITESKNTSSNLPQYSVVVKKKPNSVDSGSSKKKIDLHLSESIRRALESPLPKGPPPKKPPRTFSHVSSSIQPVSLPADPNIPFFKADIPNLKSKLDKLEKVVKTHEIGVKKDKKRGEDKKVDEEQVKNLSLASKASESPLSDGTESYHSCLPISKCLSQSTKVQNPKKLGKAKSEFYLEMETPHSNSPINFWKKHEFNFGDEMPVKKNSCEAIYDLPSTQRKNSFETFGKCSKDLKESVNSRKAEGLHYMCTDVINQSCNFLTNSQWNKTGESRDSILCSKEKHKSKSMSKIDDAKTIVRDFKLEKEDEASVNLNDSDSMLDSSDGDEAKTKQMDDESLSQLTAKRKIYLSRVSSKLTKEAPYCKQKNQNGNKHLFECCLLVGLTLNESKRNVPYVKSVFPPEMKPPHLIESLCFPDASYWPSASEDQRPGEQYYSLVVTNENGERKFGYCRRVLPEGGNVCLPLTYCIVSPHRAGGFFYKVLEELESRHGSPGIENFIKQLYEAEFPGPGERLKLKEIFEEATRTSQPDSCYISSTLVRRPPDVRLEEKDLTCLFHHLELPVLLKVFGSLLHERKVLLLSNSLRTLSSCVEALQSILLPFSWQHTYIPVLPVHLIEMCEAPTPYVIGLLKPRNVEKSLTNVHFEDGILVDLDDSKILKCCGDEGSILPLRFTRNLKTSLCLAMASDSFSESVRGVLISDAFIRFFVQICGNYSKYIEDLPNGDKIFQKEEFIKSFASNTVQSFLEWFTETAMFNCFIQERLQGNDEDVIIQLFRRRALEYSEETLKDSAVLFKNYRVINKKVRTLGDRIKDLTSFAK